jgi:DNA modification methylase
VNARKKARRHKTFGPPPKSAQQGLSQRRRLAEGASNRRRSFSQANLEECCQGPLGESLLRALRVPTEPGYQLTHAFHPYPGRFHPVLPRLLMKEGLRAGQTVLDPFMGGGTTLVEAMLLGIHSIGNDLNPVAVLVARERTRARTPVQAAKTLSEAKRIASIVESLRREKRAPRYENPNLRRIAPHYAPHLLAELAQWMRLIDGLPQSPEPAAAVRETLRAVFSAAVVKYSNQPSDSQPAGAGRSREPPAAREQTVPMVPKGSVSRFLVAKCEELTRAQVALYLRLPRPFPHVRLLQEDARLLPSLGWGEADAIITSPPYPGTYDYARQHALRMTWLGLEAAAFERGELAPRREQTAPTASAHGAPPANSAPPRESWSAGLRDVMLTLARVLKPGGSLYLVMGDWMDEDHAVDAATLLRRAAEDKGWQLGSWAAVRREAHSHRERRAFAKRGKWEHLLQFTR